MTEINFNNYHSQKFIEALTSLTEQKDINRKGVDFLKHSLTYIPWNNDLADSWNELLKLMNAQLLEISNTVDYIREMKEYLDEFDNIIQKFEIYEVLITHYFRNNRYDQALQEVNNQIDLLKYSEVSTYKNRAFHTKGVIYHVMGQLEIAEEWYLKAYRLIDEFDSEINYQIMDRSIYSLANIYQHYIGNFSKARTYYQEGLELAKVVENKERQSFFLDHLGMAEYWLSNYEAAIAHHDNAWELLQSQERSINVLFHKVQLSMALAKLGNFDRIGEELLSIADLKKTNSDPFSNIWYLILLSEYLRNKPSNLGTLKSQFEEVLAIDMDPDQILQQAKTSAEETKHIPSIVNSSLYIAKYLMKDDTTEAMALLSQGKQLAIQNNRLRELKEVERVVEEFGLDFANI